MDARRAHCAGVSSFSRIVRAPGSCVICGSNEFLQCAHGYSRSYYATRWVFDNAFCLCRSCHVFYTHRPLEWEVWREERWGPELLAELRALALTHRRPDVYELLPELQALEAVSA